VAADNLKLKMVLNGIVGLIGHTVIIGFLYPRKIKILKRAA